MDIQTNALHPNSLSARSMGGWNADAFANDQYAQVSVAALTSGTYIGPAVRVAATGITGYYCYADSANLYVDLIQSGATTNLGSFAITLVAGDVIRLEVSGTSLDCKTNGVSRITATNATLTSGRGGIIGYSNAAGSRLDNWEAGDLGGATGQGSVRRRIR